MNCLRCSKHMYKYYDSELSPQLKLEIDNHLAACPFCRFQYELTHMENEVLRDTSDIPEISPDFNKRVMNAITPEMLPHLPNDVLLMSKDKRIHFRWSSLYTKSAIAVLLLALCLYVPSIFTGGQQPRIAQNDQTSRAQKTSALDSVSITASPRPLQKQAQQSITAADSKIQSTQSGSGYDNDNSIPPRNEMGVTAPQLYAGTRMAPFETGRSERKSITLGALSVSSLSLKNIPAKYILVNRDDSIKNQIEYSYQTDDGAETISIQLITSAYQDHYSPESDNINISEPLMTLATPATPATPAASENVSREIKVEDQKISVNVSGNISKDDLNNLVDHIVISHNP